MKMLASEEQCRQCIRGCMGARSRQSPRTVEEPSGLDARGGFGERCLEQRREQGGGIQGGRRVRRAAGSSNCFPTEAPDGGVKVSLVGFGDDGYGGNNRGWVEVSPESADWGRGQQKHFPVEAGGGGRGASLGGLGWVGEEDGQMVRDKVKEDQVASWSEESWRQEQSSSKKIKRNEQTGNKLIPTLATWC